MMNQRERDSLDRWITGNYGEDYFNPDENYCCHCGIILEGKVFYEAGLETEPLCEECYKETK